MDKNTLSSEWSYFVKVDDLSEIELSLEFSPNDEETRHLARRLNVQSVQDLKVKCVAYRSPLNHLVHVKGHLQAKVIQICVVTLDPVQENVETKFEGWFGNPDRVVSIEKAKRKRMENMSGAELPVLEERDDPEPIVDGVIDIGELATQYLALSIDPYPHKEGVEFERQHDNVTQPIPESRQNPFEVLRDWKKSEEKE